MYRNSKYLKTIQPTFSYFLNKYSNVASKDTPETKDKTESSEQSTSRMAPTTNYDPNKISKEDLKWRTEWIEKEGRYYSFLRTFYKEDTGIVKRLGGQIDFSPEGIKKWLTNRNEEANIIFHSYLPDRNQKLGNDLAAAHFIVSRGGAVKFLHEDKWIKADQNKKYSLPRFFRDDKFLEAIDCQDMNIVYESLSNFRDLPEVRWLSLRGCKHIDDWCLDSISNIFCDNVVYLDLRDCPLITYRGLGALAKMNKLKMLYLDDFFRATTFELTCLLLQELSPTLEIMSDPVTFEVM